MSQQSDGSAEFNRRYSAQMAKEYAEAEQPLTKTQLALDRWWEQKLLRRALARRSEIPETGTYDEMRRFEEEMDYTQEQADRAYSRGR